MNIGKDIRFRVYICFILMCLFALAIIGKATEVIFVEGKQLRAYADSIYTRVETLKPERGNIYTEDGSLIASSIPEFDIRVDFKCIQKDTFYKYLPSLALGMAEILGDKSMVDYQLTIQEAFKKQARYYRIARRVNYSQYLKIKSLEPFVKGANKGGFLTESNTKRINPFGVLANRTVGIWRENAPNVGLEDCFNEQLKGKDGRRAMKKIAGGAWMPIDGSEISPENGKDLITTLDMNIQDVAENALMKQLEFDQAAFGTCIVMEVRTGKIKAIANLGRQEDGTYYEDKNYALMGLEPGSTTKVISLISLLNDKKVDANEMVNCQVGKIVVGRHVIDDDHPVGVVSIKDALAKSSNVAFSKLIFNNYKDDKSSYFKNLKGLHLDKTTGIEIKGESPTILNEKRAITDKYQIASMGIGYGIRLTPLHLCMVYNAVANNGKLVKPYLVNEIKEYNKTVRRFGPTILNAHAIRPEAIEDIKDAMYAVVDHGTGKKLKNPYYTICGKTGTARVVDKGVSYADRVYHASFIGFFPKEDPQYTIAVVVRTAKHSHNYYGGALALPVFQEVANRLYATHVKTSSSYVKTDSLHRAPAVQTIRTNQFNIIAKALGINTVFEKDQTWLASAKQDSTQKWVTTKLPIEKSTIPNVKGMGLRNAMYLLENSGLRVIPVGKGKVASQSIEAGTKIIKGQTITLHLG